MVFKCSENKIVFLKKYRKNWTSIGIHTRYYVYIHLIYDVSIRLFDISNIID